MWLIKKLMFVRNSFWNRFFTKKSRLISIETISSDTTAIIPEYKRQHWSGKHVVTIADTPDKINKFYYDMEKDEVSTKK